jgi:hypothetical protein
MNIDLQAVSALGTSIVLCLGQIMMLFRVGLVPVSHRHKDSTERYIFDTENEENSTFFMTLVRLGFIIGVHGHQPQLTNPSW